MVTVHETEWCEDEDAAKIPIGGNVAFQDWKLGTSNGDVLGAGSDINCKYSRLDCLLMMFPHAYIQKNMTLTNCHLTTTNKPQNVASRYL